MKTVFKIKRYKTIVSLFGLLLLLAYMTLQGVEQSTETIVVSQAVDEQPIYQAVEVQGSAQITANAALQIVESEPKPKQLADRTVELANLSDSEFPEWINATYESMSPQEIAQAKASIPTDLQNKIANLSFPEQAAIYAAVAIGLELEKNK